MGGWMGGWMAGWMDGWAGGRVGGWTDGWMDGWVDGWIDASCGLRDERLSKSVFIQGRTKANAKTRFGKMPASTFLSQGLLCLYQKFGKLGRCS